MSVLQNELDDAYKKAENFGKHMVEEKMRICFNPVITFSVQSKRGTRAITRLHIDSSLSQDEVQQDLGVLAQQALPIEFRHDRRKMWETC